ncbi:MAG: alpha-L-fucosidase [Haliscomenobacter sp.]|nr:alpha-L-fucosidase [Haliscomenobacter sp.]
MRYSVFVKHHDGFCMFDTKATDYNIMATPYQRDVAKLFAEACQRQGLALGWQFFQKIGNTLIYIRKTTTLQCLLSAIIG